MRSLKDILKESILDDIDTQINKSDKDIKNEIQTFLKENFAGISSCKISRKPNSDGKYEVSSTKDIKVKNKNITSLTNGMFIWTKVDETFNCSFCDSLELLEGAPKEVGKSFHCYSCSSLKSLEGAPKKVGGDFDCANCYSLKTLEGAPKEIGGSFYCGYCRSLISLEGAPKEVGGDFICWGRKVQFVEEYVRKISNVKGEIIC